MGFRSQDRYGSCEGLAGTLNKLVNRGYGKPVGGLVTPSDSMFDYRNQNRNFAMGYGGSPEGAPFHGW